MLLLVGVLASAACEKRAPSSGDPVVPGASPPREWTPLERATDGRRRAESALLTALGVEDSRDGTIVVETLDAVVEQERYAELREVLPEVLEAATRGLLELETFDEDAATDREKVQAESERALLDALRILGMAAWSNDEETYLAAAEALQEDSAAPYTLRRVLYARILLGVYAARF